MKTIQGVEVGQMAFLNGSTDAAGAVHAVHDTHVVIYVENAGDFKIPLSAVNAVHDGKIILKTDGLDRKFLDAVKHVHDREDPNVEG